MNPAIGLAWNPAVGIPMLFVGIVVLVLLWLFGQPRKEQGRRKPAPEQSPERARDRREPVFSDDGEVVESFAARGGDDLEDPLFRPTTKQPELDVDLRAELERLGASLAGDRSASAGQAGHEQPFQGHARRAPEQAPVDPMPYGDAPNQGASQPHAPNHVAPHAPAPTHGAGSQRVEPRFDLPFDIDEHVSAAQPPASGASSRQDPSFAGEPTYAAAPVPAPAPVRPPAPPAPPKAPPRSDLGRRPPNAQVERIVSLFVVSREGTKFNGSDLVVAAEKAGLEFGDMGIYHRLVDGHPELGPIFSVANLVKPGNFDMGRIATLQTPGLSFFMALPAPIPALDAWDTMLPAAQRLAELLDGLVLDEERNALGRQRIAHIRDELRGWDRGHEGEEIKFGQ
jgi:cell division protein ZipA